MEREGQEKNCQNGKIFYFCILMAYCMCRSMGHDKSYEYFQKALSEWIAQKKRNNEAPQKILAIETNSHEGTISKLLNPKREKPISFEKQVALANACGYDYIDFLQLGRKLIEGSAGNTVPGKEKTVETLDPVVSMHQDLIKGFKERDIAKHITQNLIKIEALDPKKYYMLAGKIENMAEELENAAEENKGDKDNDQGKHQTA